MKIVKLSNLTPGKVTDVEYCTEKGKVLLSKGVTITENHIQILKRRNISNLYKKTLSEDEQLQEILSTKYELEELDLDDQPAGVSPRSVPEPELLDPAKAFNLPKFKNIKTGLEGLEQLNKSKYAADLDKRFKSGRTPDRPVGPALKDEVKEKSPAERTEVHKNQSLSLYDDALDKVKMVLNTLANGKKMDGNKIRKIIEVFVRQFITDKNILLNLSTTRCNDSIYIYNHSLNVCLLAINISASFGYSKEQVIEIGMGALLNDVGMLLIPKNIYTKKGRLNREEWFEIQKHPIMGLHLLESVSRLPESIPYIAYQSHERENSTGYPKKRNERLIHYFSKIVQIADIYIALSSPRSYREAYMPYKAMEAIIKMTNEGLISGEFTKALLAYTSLFPVGSLVELNDNSTAKVIKANGTSFAKPTVSVLTNKKGKLLQQKNIYQINLSDETNMHIVKALKSDHLPHISIMDGF